MATFIDRRRPDAPPQPVTVVVADDHDHFRNGLVRALNGHDGITVVAEAADGQAALDQIRRWSPRVAIIDVRMPHVGGLGLTRLLVADPALSSVRIVLMSAHHDKDVARAAVDAGAIAYVDKASPRDVICEAVLAAGERRGRRSGR